MYKFNEWKALTDFLAQLKSTSDVRITLERGEWNVLVDQPVKNKHVKPKIATGVGLYDLYW